MSDIFSPDVRKRIMQAVKSTHSQLENTFSANLWRKGARFRRNVASLPGNPDIAIKKYRVVIFIDSCFWHKCESHCKMPKSNTEYWCNKLKRNAIRDKEITNYYVQKGWIIRRIWEHQLKTEFSKTVDDTFIIIEQAKNNLR